MPQDPDNHLTPVKSGIFIPHEELLSYEELLRVVRLTAAMGMKKIRLTGGEPLVRKGVVGFIRKMMSINGLEQVRLTTNGVLLEEYAGSLWHAGVRQLNVSLDTLQPEKFTRITGKDYFDRVWKGLQLAMELGFTIKINVVAMKGINDDEFVEFARLSTKYPLQIRFIEFMPMGNKDTWQKEHYISADEIKTMIAKLGVLQQMNHEHGEGPAQMFMLQSMQGAVGKVGFISPISHHFCDRCNRLRLTSTGSLRACLLNDSETELKPLLRGNATDYDIANVIRQTIVSKPRGHALATGDQDDGIRQAGCQGQMSRIGG